MAKFPGAAPDFARLLIRWLCLLVILSAELVGITSWFEAPIVDEDADWPAWLVANSKEIWRIGIWSIIAILFILSPQFQTLFNTLQAQSSEYRWPVWLVRHLVAFIALVCATAHIFEESYASARFSAVWLSGWFALASATFLLWLLALAPGYFWLRLIRQEYKALLMGAGLGLYLWMLVGMLVQQEAPLAQKELWHSLSNLTLQFVYALLNLVYSELVYQPEMLIVGTVSFHVLISYACSGIEGISLITLFIAIYLWLFYKELRFPQALWLFPFGIITIWLANVVRITILIAIGTSFSAEIAARNFHSHAGWVAFTLIAFGVIILSQRIGLRAVAGQGSPAIRHNNPLAAALLVPLMVWMATALITAPFSSGFDVLYPLQVIAVAAALWHYRKAYHVFDWNWSWRAVGIGVVVFLLWVMLEPSVDNSQTELARGLVELPSWAAAIWLVFRVLGLVIIAPLAEEFAFRGYILRKLSARDFANVPLDRFTWLSFIVSSVLFGLLHNRWLAGTLAGMAYALALRHRGQLGDAVLAHATTNMLIAISVLVQGRWSLWS